ncbi:MAG: hypothetical protein HYR63_14115 [Proteobacteria bacterium]|nr:hypothetical protein [Pseudomonadota bacterium]
MIRLDYLVDGRGTPRSTEAAGHARHAVDRRIVEDGWVQLMQGLDFIGVRFAPDTVKQQALDVATRTLIVGRNSWRWLSLSAFVDETWHRSLPVNADAAIAAMHRFMRQMREPAYLSRRLPIERAFQDRHIDLIKSLSFARAQGAADLLTLVDFARANPDGRTTVLYRCRDDVWRFAHIGHGIRHFGSALRQSLAGQPVMRSHDQSYAERSLRLVEEAVSFAAPTLRDHDAVLERPGEAPLHSTYRSLRAPVPLADGVAVLSTFQPLTQSEILFGGERLRAM